MSKFAFKGMRIITGPQKQRMDSSNQADSQSIQAQSSGEKTVVAMNPPIAAIVEKTRLRRSSLEADNYARPEKDIDNNYSGKSGDVSIHKMLRMENGKEAMEIIKDLRNRNHALKQTHRIRSNL